MQLEKVENAEKFYIYGAQVIAIGAYTGIKGLTGRKPEAFLVSKLSGNPDEINGIPVSLPDNVDRNALIIVAVTELIQKELVPELEKKGFKNLIIMSQHEEHMLMSKYFDSVGRFPCAKEGTGITSSKLAIYEVSNHRDQPLSAHPKLLSYEYSIQAGADIADRIICDILDNTGDNISSKNKQYCEMTASYWVWKNTNHDWKGIEHYRRHLLVKPEHLADDVDAILPLPYICYPNTMYQFRRFVSEEVKDALFKALKDLHPNEYDRYCDILYGQYQYTYNLVVAKRKIFDDYCTWFFEITEYMENMGDEVTDIRDTRALSYVAEVLTNLYFMYHSERLKIRHVEKAIYV